MRKHDCQPVVNFSHGSVTIHCGTSWATFCRPGSQPSRLRGGEKLAAMADALHVALERVHTPGADTPPSGWVSSGDFEVYFERDERRITVPAGKSTHYPLDASVAADLQAWFAFTGGRMATRWLDCPATLGYVESTTAGIHIDARDTWNGLWLSCDTARTLRRHLLCACSLEAVTLDDGDGVRVTVDPAFWHCRLEIDNGLRPYRANISRSGAARLAVGLHKALKGDTHGQ